MLESKEDFVRKFNAKHVVCDNEEIGIIVKVL